jgi:hypothetical protein
VRKLDLFAASRSTCYGLYPSLLTCNGFSTSGKTTLHHGSDSHPNYRTICHQTTRRERCKPSSVGDATPRSSPTMMRSGYLILTIRQHSPTPRPVPLENQQNQTVSEARLLGSGAFTIMARLWLRPGGRRRSVMGRVAGHERPPERDYDDGGRINGGSRPLGRRKAPLVGSGDCRAVQGREQSERIGRGPRGQSIRTGSHCLRRCSLADILA